MNFSFLALIVTLGGMAVLTSYNRHVLFLMAVSTGLWVTMIWYARALPSLPASLPGIGPRKKSCADTVGVDRFVAEISKVQTQPQNAPPPSVPSEAEADADLSRTPPPDLLSSADTSAPLGNGKSSATQSPEIRQRKN